MEENSNLTAERSLEIITEQIAQSRKSASRNAGQSLFIAGLCIIGIALLVSICYLLTQNMAIYLLYALIPVLVIGIDYYLKRNKPKALLASSAQWLIRPGRHSASSHFPSLCFLFFSTG